MALERGDKKGARHQYERILGKALIGQGAPAAHWAHSEYAWLLFEDGNLEVSPFCLDKKMLQDVLSGVCRHSQTISSDHHEPFIAVLRYTH